MTTKNKKKDESIESPQRETKVFGQALKGGRVSSARLSAFAPNPDVPDWRFYGVNTEGIRDVRSDSFDLELREGLVHITSKKTGLTVVSHFDWLVLSDPFPLEKGASRSDQKGQNP